MDKEFEAMAKKIPGLKEGTVAYGWVQAAYQAGRRAGEESMRERAAKVCVDTGGMTAEDCADAIRALPVGE